MFTNWHNVTGLRADTLQNNGSFFPNELELNFKLLQPGRTEGEVLIVGRRAAIPLYAEGTTPMWIEHPQRNNVDVAALLISTDVYAGGEVCCINDMEFETRWQMEAGADCFVVGYPEGLEGQYVTPIWKRGSIATEPKLNYRDKPQVLVDTLGNQGLSGAPVIAQASGIFVPNGGTKVTADTSIGTWQNFLGVYSGREGEEGLGFQLGRVWKAICVDEICAAGIAGYHPKQA